MLTNTRRQQLESWQGVRVRLHAEPELSDEELSYDEDAADLAQNIKRLRSAPPWTVEQVALVVVLGAFTAASLVIATMTATWHW